VTIKYRTRLLVFAKKETVDPNSNKFDAVMIGKNSTLVGWVRLGEMRLAN
jgi:hypothetical protein